jgi:hypothetical protein
MIRSLLFPALLAALLAAVSPAQTTRTAAAGPAPRSSAAMTYDATGKVVLLFGGSGARRFRDLWAWDGRGWERLANSGPAPRDDAILAHDPVRRRTILFGGRGTGGSLADTWEWDGAAWTRMDVPGPGRRLHAAGAFDSEAGCLRIHGGLAPDDSALTDTWEWDGEKWRRVAERGPVAGRLVNRMVHDPVRRATLLSVFDPGARDANGTFPLELWRWSSGGWDAVAQLAPSISPIQDMSAHPSGGILLHDGGALQGSASTWTWRRGTWELAASLTADGPSPRNGHALACDPDRGRVVLFGGFRDGADLDDTWEWDGERWRRMSPPARIDAATRPPARFAASIAFDAARGELLIHGGEGSDGGASSETWAWDGAHWRRAATAVPSRRFWGSMAHDPLRARTVLFGGIGPDGALGDTWEWDGAAWTRVASAGPAPRYAHELAYDPVRRRIVLFGGRDATGVMRDLWEWDGVRWTLVAADGPSPRFTHALAFDAARSELLAFAGHGPGSGGTLEPLPDLWLRDGAGWRESSASGPGAMDHVSAAFDVARGRTVVLNAGPMPSGGPRTWEWDGTAWGSFDAPIDILSGHRVAYDALRGRVLLWTGISGTDRSRILAWNGASWTQVEP